MKTYSEIIDLFEQANMALLIRDQSLFLNQVSERTLCGALMLHIHDIIKQNESYTGYYADVEYNRNKGSIKTVRKTIRGPGEEIIPINCDLILHSRGAHIEQDNLLAVEMKKSTRRSVEKNKDRERLIALTNPIRCPTETAAYIPATGTAASRKGRARSCGMAAAFTREAGKTAFPAETEQRFSRRQSLYGSVRLLHPRPQSAHAPRTGKNGLR